jgi:hypothetical protein
MCEAGYPGRRLLRGAKRPGKGGVYGEKSCEPKGYLYSCLPGGCRLVSFRGWLLCNRAYREAVLSGGRQGPALSPPTSTARICHLEFQRIRRLPLIGLRVLPRRRMRGMLSFRSSTGCERPWQQVSGQIHRFHSAFRRSPARRTEVPHGSPTTPCTHRRARRPRQVERFALPAVGDGGRYAVGAEA